MLSIWICRIGLIAIRFFSISLLLESLGVERYATLSVLVSFEGWFNLCDFGLGSSVQNFLSEARAQNHSTEKLMGSVVHLCVLLLCLLLLLVICVGTLVSEAIFSHSQYTTAFQLTALFYGTTALGSVAYRALLAFQRGRLAYFVQFLASLLGLGAVVLLPTTSILEALCYTVGIPTLVSLATFAQIFPLRALFTPPDWAHIYKIARRAMHFLGFGLMNAAILAIDYLVMVRLLAAEEIVVYNIFSRIFLALFSIYALFLNAVWPVCSEQIVTGRSREMLVRMRRYCFYGMGWIVLTTAGVMLGSQTLQDLFSLKTPLALSTLGLFGLYYALRVVCDSYSIVLQSMNRLRIFFLIGPCQALISYTAQTFLAKHYGLNGIVWGLICAFASTALWALPWAVYHQTNKEQRA